MTTTLTPSMRRSMLISTLRDRTLWPEDFVWNYRNCRTCAMGLLLRLLGHQEVFSNDWEIVRSVEFLLGLTREQMQPIFLGIYDADKSAVMPETVAYRLEKLHEGLTQ